jgi:tryptophan-rich sensory protein
MKIVSKFTGAISLGVQLVLAVSIADAKTDGWAAATAAVAVSPVVTISTISTTTSKARHGRSHKESAGELSSPIEALSSSSSSSSSSLYLSQIMRGGGCADTDSKLFIKLGTSAVLETALMLLTLVASAALSDKFPNWIPSILNLPLTQLLAAFSIIFASSIFGSLIDGGISAATKQVLAPDVIPGDSKWYSNLKKPSWNPPGYLFPIMWLLISKPTQLCAVSRVLKYGSTYVDGASNLPLWQLMFYCFHLSLGDTWNKVFFGLQCPGRGAAVITAFFACLLLSTVLFIKLDYFAGYYMLPTCGWVAVATALQWNIYLNNKPKSKTNSTSKSNMSKKK